MHQTEIDNAVARIEKMESLFDKLLGDFKSDRSCIDLEKLFVLIDYYENGQWLFDFNLDERGLLPKNLKRGILSEDGFYNFLTDINELICDRNK